MRFGRHVSRAGLTFRTRIFDDIQVAMRGVVALGSLDAALAQVATISKVRE